MQPERVASILPAAQPLLQRSVALVQKQLAWRLCYLALFLLASVLLLVNLTTSPAPWFDEGLNLSTAATLARTGRYALPDSAGARVLDPAIQTGPPLLVPITLVYRWFGVGILQGRLVMVTFALLALGAYALLARRLVGRAAALLALLLLLTGTNEPYNSFLPMARQALGEVTAVGLLMYGLWLWLRAVARPDSRVWELAIIGLAFGLAMVTKSQVLVVFPVAWAAYALLDRLYYRQASWRAFIVPGAAAAACVGAWYLAQRGIVGAEGFARNAAVLRAGFGIHIAGLKLAHMQTALGALWRVGFFFWGLPGLVYGVSLALRRDRAGFAHGGLLLFTLLWLGWYVVLSIGWARYGFVALMLLPIWSARLLCDLADGTLAPQLPISAPQRRALVGLVVALCVVWQGAAQARAIFGAQDRSLEQFAAYLRANVPADAVVESWEWELDVVAPQRFHHPPTEITNAITLRMTGGVADVRYDLDRAPPEYLVAGPFSSWTGLYRDTVKTPYHKVVQIGAYALYRVTR